MAKRIVVFPMAADAHATSVLKTIRAAFPKAKVSSVATARAYTVDAKLSASDIDKVARRLANPVIERYATGVVHGSRGSAWSVEIGFLPGVTDNVGRTARQTLEDTLRKKLRAGEDVYSSLLLFFTGTLSKKEVEEFTRELYNPLIERASIYPANKSVPIVVPKVTLHGQTKVDEVDLDVSDEELARIGKEGIASEDGTRRGPLALSLPYMKAIQAHFKKLGRKPTDVELESLAQTWSEHCKHTIFADPLDEIKEGIYRRYIKGATERIRKEKGKKDFCVSVFKDNSGAIEFDDKYLVTHKVETHNSPSALDPFGGAITGIVGVNRDALGFGLGAKPIANTYGFCVGDPEDTTELYRDQEKTQPLLPSRRILEGVIKGINAGGNESGIPTPLGFVAVDPRYRGKPLVFAGTVGLIPKKLGKKKLYEKAAQPGDYIVMAGGRVGLDGIHGATFSSESLSKGSPATSVQIGDAITQKKLSDAIIREARDEGLYTSITDNGAGGLSSSVGEMAKESGGCIVDLAKVPLKYPGLSPWQIWISESQERMTLAVPKSSWPKLKKIFDRHGVEASVVGSFTDSERCIVRHGRNTVMDLDMEFLHDGRPIGIQKSKKVVLKHTEPKRARLDLGKALLGLLARPNIGSIAFISQQYDHEVQASAITKPLQGRGRVNAEAGVLRPIADSPRGIVVSDGYCPWYSDIDTYDMAAAAIDTAVRNAIAAGASLEYLAILDNFCWSSSNTPERLYELKRAAKACFDIATVYGTPYISGKDSMFNDFRGYTKEGRKIHVAAPPTLLISTLGVLDDVTKAMTIDLKQPGDMLYVIGDTNDELGASEYFAMKGAIGNKVPKVSAKKNKRSYVALAHAIESGLVASAIGVGRGGLAIAIAKSAIAGKLGVKVDLSQLRGNAKDADAALFSESQGRVLVSVRPDLQRSFEKAMRGVSISRMGAVSSDSMFFSTYGKQRIELPLSDLAEAYRAPFKDW